MESLTCLICSKIRHPFRLCKLLSNIIAVHFEQTHWLTSVIEASYLLWIKSTIQSLHSSGGLLVESLPLEIYCMPLTNGFREPLLQTLQNYGVHQQILRWLAHYLCSHTQSVCVNGSSSDILPVSSRVLLATVLGPLLFIIYINHIPNLQPSNSSMTSYADDIMLYHPCNSHTCWLYM